MTPPFSSIQHKLVPGPGRLIIKPSPSSEQQTKGGIIIPSTASDPRYEGIIGEVVAVHDKKYIENGRVIDGPDYALGAWVIVGQHTGTKVTLNRETFIVVTEQAVIAELVPEDTPSAEPS